MPKRTKKVKAEAFTRKVCTDEPYGVESMPLWSLPRTAEAYDAMVEQMARAIHGGSWTYDVGEDHTREGYRDDAKAALRAIGITRPKEDKP